MSFWLLGLIAIGLSSCSQKYEYESVPNDPLNARIYTLDNGLKVYMTINNETPRIQTYIAVRVGGKNDPAETTGLAHYFEHLMFKGTQQFGTQNYALEKPLLDEIEAQFEIYRKTTDEAQRKAIYHVIDSLSYEASKLAIPNEYDKLMAAIGANGTNAYTSFDVTCYTEDIPSNQIENWAKIQADRFENNVIRGFHTELETVYEEKNMSLTRDARKVQEALLAALFPDHPYGTQTVLGTQDHLKNPSITNIKNYYKTWYVPNNMAICLSGDFDPEQMIATIDKYFGQMQPNPNLPLLDLSKEANEIAQPIVREVYGIDAENVALAWRLPKAASREAETLELLSEILYNGQAGLIDLNLMQQQKVLGAYAFNWIMSDHSLLMMQGRPKQGQTLDEVKELLLAEVKKLREGQFDETLIEATINNFKLYQQKSLERNDARADMFVTSFINGTDWADEVSKMQRQSKLTKEDLVAFANKYLKESNLAVVYKRQGKDPNEKKIAKPAITPIVMNRDTVSPFLKAIQESEVAPIEPVFVDFEKDLTKLTTANGLPILYSKNELNDIFQLVYRFDMGNIHDKALGTAAQYLDYLGTTEMTAEQVKSEFHRMACRFSVQPSNERTYVILQGLNENMPEAIKLFEKLLAEAKVDNEAYQNMVADILKARNDAKLNQSQNFSRLTRYVQWGPQNSSTHILTEAELKKMNPQELLNKIKELKNYKHRIIYHGSYAPEEIVALIEKEHKTPATLKEVPAGITFEQQPTTETKIYLAPYDAKQIYMMQYNNLEKQYDPTIESGRQLYSEYFGGGMNSIVFQEMRESRGLAYSAWASLAAPTYKQYNYCILTQIATQNDKMMDAINTFNDIINNMPQSEAAFKLAKEGMIARLRTDRLTGIDIAWTYIDNEDLGITGDKRKQLYQEIQNMTLKDVVDFQQKWVKNRIYHYAILGDKKELDMAALKKLGTVIELKTEDIFGY